MEHGIAFGLIARLAQAQGVVATQADCSLDEALQTMGERAYVEHRTLYEIAVAVLDRTISFGAPTE
jgi:AmiR/NasT family two-component response regulator